MATKRQKSASPVPSRRSQSNKKPRSGWSRKRTAKGRIATTTKATTAVQAKSSNIKVTNHKITNKTNNKYRKKQQGY